VRVANSRAINRFSVLKVHNYLIVERGDFLDRPRSLEATIWLASGSESLQGSMGSNWWKPSEHWRDTAR
jgi:hypothetical protein